ncbi:DUF4893 domain-containing protein [Sphingomonas parva]|nr:DUF4893 domain-containing protein [Sphingomonas parva]
MSRLLPVLPFLLLPALAACQTAAPQSPAGRPSVQIEETEEWRSAATVADAALLDGLPAAWTQALTETRRRYRRAVAVEGALLEPDSGLSRAAPTPGPYRCRAVRIGARVATARPWSTTRSGFCYVGIEGDQLSLTSEIPGLRFGGYLWDDRETRRLVFLGAATAARARTAGAYGEDTAADRIGIFERIGDYRFRLVLPAREGEARLAVVELLAAPNPE